MQKFEKESWYIEFGKNKLGPLLYAYTKWLYFTIKEDCIDNIFFFARDGYLMEKAFELFERYYKLGIRFQYVYFSRKSIRQAMLWHCTSYEDSLKYMSTSRYISLGGILEYYGFDQDERKQIAEQNKLFLGSTFLNDNLVDNEEVRDIFGKLEKVIYEKSYEQDKLLRQYIDQIGMYGRCAIVDIGWHGRMQNYLETYFDFCNIPFTCSGYYLGIQTIVPVIGKTKGFLFDNKFDKLRKSVLTFFGGYEKLFQSQEGSTYGYKKENERVIPQLGKYEYYNNSENVNFITKWQSSALKFVKQALEDNIPVDFDMVKPLIRFGKYPSLKAIKMLSFLYNEDGEKKYFISQKSLWKYNPKEFIYALSNSSWKTGFMRSVFKLPLPYYFIYWICRK